MGSPSTLGVSTSGASTPRTSAPPASGPPPGAIGDFSKALADELQRRLDEEGWQAGNPAPGRPAAPGGEKAEHPLLRAGPGDLGIRFVNRDEGTGPSNPGTGPSRLLGFSAPGAALFKDSAPKTSRLPGEASRFPSEISRSPGKVSRFLDEAGNLASKAGQVVGRAAIAGAGFAARAALPAAGGVGILLASTTPAGRERETSTTAGADHFTVDERTIDVRRADGTRQQGFLNPDGNPGALLTGRS